jgi:hypothetical protein
MTAPYSRPWQRHRLEDRLYWLPPGGIGNGLDAPSWAPIIDADASDLMLLLDELRAAGIAAYAARLGRPHRRAPSLFRIWWTPGPIRVPRM